MAIAPRGIECWSNPLQIRPCPATIFGRGSAFAARAYGIETPWIERQDRFESEVTDPVIDEVVDVGQALPAVQVQGDRLYLATLSLTFVSVIFCL